MKAYLAACKTSVQKRIDAGKPMTWRTGQEMFDWWMERGIAPREADHDQG
jgi:hypothetical protein